jgi:hypothetical protein
MQPTLDNNAIFARNLSGKWISESKEGNDKHVWELHITPYTKTLLVHKINGEMISRKNLSNSVHWMGNYILSDMENYEYDIRMIISPSEDRWLNNFIFKERIDSAKEMEFKRVING